MNNIPSAAEVNKQMEQQYMYWNVSATLVYVDTETPKGKLPEVKFWPLSIFHRSMNPMCGAELSKVNERLVFEFMKQYDELHQDVQRNVRIIPEVRRMILGSISFLGVMTHAQWVQGVEAQEGPQEPAEAQEAAAPGSQQG